LPRLIRAEARDIRAEEAAQRAEISLALSIESANRAERAFALSEARFTIEEDKRQSEINADFNDYINGIISFEGIALENRNAVIGGIRRFLNTETNNLESLNNKFRVAKESKEVITLTDDEIRLQVYDDFVNGTDLNKVKSGINASPISNKDRANFIAEEIYGVNKQTEGASISEIQVTEREELFKGKEPLEKINLNNLRIPSLFRY